MTDVAPPTSASLARLPDVRVVQYWDRDHVVSADIVRAVRASPDRYALGEGIDAGTLVWDTVVVFPPGARWEPDVPPPAYYGFPVVQAAPELEAALLKAATREPPAAPAREPGSGPSTP